MYQFRTLVITLAGTLFSTFAIAGGASGGGGKGVLCLNPSGRETLEILEQYEARKLNIKLPIATGSLEKEIELHGRLISDYLEQTTSSQGIDAIKKGYQNLLSNYFENRRHLPVTKDVTLKVPLDSRCQLVQIALNVNEEVTQHLGYARIKAYRDPYYWKRLDSFGQFLLINHELTSFMDRLFDPLSGKKHVFHTTDVVRDFLIQLYSGKIRNRLDGRPLGNQFRRDKIRSRLKCKTHPFGMNGNGLGISFYAYGDAGTIYDSSLSSFKFALTSLGYNARLWIPTLFKPETASFTGSHSQELLTYALFSGGELRLDDQQPNTFLTYTLPSYLFDGLATGEFPIEVPLDFQDKTKVPFVFQFKLSPLPDQPKTLILSARIIRADKSEDEKSQPEFFPINCEVENF